MEIDSDAIVFGAARKHDPHPGRVEQARCEAPGSGVPGSPGLRTSQAGTRGSRCPETLVDQRLGYQPKGYGAASVKVTYDKRTVSRPVASGYEPQSLVTAIMILG